MDINPRMYIKKDDWDRVLKIKTPTEEGEEYRAEARRDYARLIHSPSFRRLQGKTQLFPSTENDFFRNRLTHSIEVAQVAKDIAIRINGTEFKDEKDLHLDTDLIEFAAFAHDLGHPPFGHQGEEALDECMIDNGGFEGNAQTLRILSRLEKRHFQLEYPNGFDEKLDKDMRVGLNLTYRTLASILKYDTCTPVREDERKKFSEALRDKGEGDGCTIKPVKGYYESEFELVEEIKKHVTQGKSYSGKFKTIECKIMDIADDIAYSTYDLEDGFKAGFYTPLELVSPDNHVINRVYKKVYKSLEKLAEEGQVKKPISFEKKQIIKILRDIFATIFPESKIKDGETIQLSKEEFEKEVFKGAVGAYKVSNSLASDGHNRTDLTSKLIGQYIKKITVKRNNAIPALWDVQLEEDARIQIEVLKQLTHEYQILSPRLKIVEFRGKDIVTQVFEALASPKGYELLPKDFRKLYDSTITGRKRVVCDFIAGMTDKYLIEFYGRLKSESPETIFKPI